MKEACSLICTVLIGLFRTRSSLAAEILVLRHQINVLRRHSPKRQTFSSADRLIFAWLYRLAPTVPLWMDALPGAAPPVAPRSPQGGRRRLSTIGAKGHQYSWRFGCSRPQSAGGVVVSSARDARDLWSGARAFMDKNCSPAWASQLKSPSTLSVEDRAA
jgi:hypothetical protein